MERRAVRRLAVATGAVTALAAIALGHTRWPTRWRAGWAPPGVGARARAARPAPRGPRVPDSIRIRVEVLNASTVPGLARRATMQLRDLGFDVVYTGTSAEPYDSVVVVDRSGHPEWARLAARAMGAGRWVSRLDTSRYLDLTVLVGAAWHPPAEPFYP